MAMDCDDFVLRNSQNHFLQMGYVNNMHIGSLL